MIFGIKITNMHGMDHLDNALKEHNTFSIKMRGSLFCGIHLTWNYTLGHIDCHMPGYINNALTKYQHPKPVFPQHAPCKAAPIEYGARVQRVEFNTTQPLTPKEIKHIQDIIGTLLYYVQAVDPTLLAALSAIAACQSNNTWAVDDACHQLLGYIATHPNAGICYKACNMVLSVHTEASYLSKPGGKNRAAGHFYLSNQNDKDFINGTILTLSTIIKHIMSSASKAELAVLYYGCKLAAPLQTTSEDKSHVQPTPTPVTTNNITTQGPTMGTMTLKSSKLMDQCFHWLKCWHVQRRFQYLWRKGILNCANYSSKHHAPKHHQNERPFFVFDNSTFPKQ
jgi:hypothetical protein